MTRRFLPALLLLAPLGALAGGWAVVTVDQLPEYLVAGKQATLTFMVRQHGVTPLKGVHPTLEARTGSRFAQGSVAPGKGDGQYVATFTLPEPGDWTLTIHSGWGSSKLTLLAVKVIEPGSSAPIALAAAELGRHLFVAKGCVGCHVRAEGKCGRGCGDRTVAHRQAIRAGLPATIPDQSRDGRPAAQRQLRDAQPQLAADGDRGAGGLSERRHKGHAIKECAVQRSGTKSGSGGTGTLAGLGVAGPTFFRVIFSLRSPPESSNRSALSLRL